MNNNKIQLDKRLEDLLRIIIEDYIETAVPVSSSLILKKYDSEFSSATIRNDMVKLEDYGCIIKHHYAAGRIPTNFGYQYYVDHLLNENNNIQDLQQQIDKIFQNRKLSIDEVMSKSCEVISGLTNLATLIAGERNRFELRKIQIIPLSAQSVTGILVTSDGTVRSKVFTIPEEINIKDLEQCVQYLNDRLNSITIADLQQGIRGISEIVKKNIQSYENLLQNLLFSLVSTPSNQPHVYGISKIIANPEFSNPEKIQFLLQIFEKNSIWDYFSAPSSSFLNFKSIELALPSPLRHKSVVVFGEEINPNFKDISIITNNYSIDGKNNQISIIGPKRMNYQKITSLLEWLTSKIEEYAHNRAKNIINIKNKEVDHEN